jgi:beta-glucosidase
MNYRELIGKMTLEEKTSLFSGGGQFYTKAVKRLGIPSLYLSDGPNGVRKQAGAADHLGLNASLPATCFPTASAMANSWDPELGEEVGRRLGEEAAAQGVRVLLGPGLNIKRSPLCGRNFEYFSEDPYLAGKMAAAYIRGIQSRGTAACPKHFAANNQELLRMHSDSVIDERTLHEIYLTGFEIAVTEGRPLSLMSSYNRINGTYASEAPWLLRKTLVDRWGFSGFVVTDWGGEQ